MILSLLFDTPKLLNISEITNRIGSFFSLPFHFFKGDAYPELAFILSFTAGGQKSAYTREGYQHYEMADFMPPFKAMANLCGLELLPEIMSYGMMIVDPTDTEHNAEVLRQAKEHGKRLAEAVKAQ